VGVELGAVHTREPGAGRGDDPAAAAHAGAVHHQRVEADDRGDAVRAGDLGHDLHHPHRPDRQDEVDGPAGRDQFLDPPTKTAPAQQP
jgi:hypothetical protein